MIMRLGIDPGLDGALAFYEVRNAEPLVIVDMPTVTVTRNNREKRELSAPAFANLIAGKGLRYVAIERVGAMPGQGVSSVFSFGRSAGIIEGVLAAYEVPYWFVLPRVWQKAVDVRGGKDGSRERAMQLFPRNAAEFARKKDDGRADAALIAHWAACYYQKK